MYNSDMDKINFKEIYPKIYVYSNVFEDVDKVLDYLKETEDKTENTAFGPWRDWYGFGRHALFSMIDDVKDDKEMYIVKSTFDAFKKVSTHYIKNHNLPINEHETILNRNKEEVPLWQYPSPGFAKYWKDSGADVGSNKAMQFHTDFDYSLLKNDGYKFCVTGVTYLNDNYDGGEIEFFVDGNLFKYKPQKGDIVIFPSGNPNFLTENNEQYYHSAKVVKNGEKYLVRQYCMRYETVLDDWKKEWDDNIISLGMEGTLKFYRNQQSERMSSLHEKIENSKVLIINE